jgi:hypothetical protein
MELTKQVVSLSLAKRLKELGVKQESIFWWSERYLLENPSQKSIDVRFMMNPDFKGTAYSYHHEKDLYAAFTVAELGEMLPKYVINSFDEKKYALSIGFRLYGTTGESRPYCEYWNPYEGKRDFRIGDGSTSETEADARAKMLIYLIENNLLTPSLSVEEK